MQTRYFGSCDAADHVQIVLKMSFRHLRVAVILQSTSKHTSIYTEHAQQLRQRNQIAMHDVVQTGCDCSQRLDKASTHTTTITVDWKNKACWSCAGLCSVRAGWLFRIGMRAAVLKCAMSAVLASSRGAFASILRIQHHNGCVCMSKPTEQLQLRLFSILTLVKGGFEGGI